MEPESVAGPRRMYVRTVRRVFRTISVRPPQCVRPPFPSFLPLPTPGGVQKFLPASNSIAASRCAVHTHTQIGAGDLDELPKKSRCITRGKCGGRLKREKTGNAHVRIGAIYSLVSRTSISLEKLFFLSYLSFLASSSISLCCLCCSCCCCFPAAAAAAAVLDLRRSVGLAGNSGLGPGVGFLNNGPEKIKARVGFFFQGPPR